MEREVKTYVLKRPDEEAVPRKLSINYAAALNPQQLAAVTAGEGPSLVIAGAGSGKTRTLVYRVAYLIDSGVDPSNILLLTFTRKSAQEMLERAGDLIGTQQPAGLRRDIPLRCESCSCAAMAGRSALNLGSRFWIAAMRKT